MSKPSVEDCPEGFYVLLWHGQKTVKVSCHKGLAVPGDQTTKMWSVIKTHSLIHSADHSLKLDSKYTKEKLNPNEIIELITLNRNIDEQKLKSNNQIYTLSHSHGSNNGCRL